MMRLLPVVGAVLGLALCVAAVSVKSEKMIAISEGSTVPQNWQEVNVEVDYTATVNLTVALKRRNMDELEKEALDRSNPKSPNYAQWFTREQIIERTQPLPSALQAVLEWLQQCGVTHVQVGANRDTIAVIDTPLATAEKVLDLQFRTYEEVDSKKTMVRAIGQIRLPESVRKYVQTIVGASGFPILHSAIKSEESPDYLQIDPAIIVKRYNVTIDAPTSPNNLKAVAEFQGEYITQSEVCSFFNHFKLNGNCKINKIIGPNQNNNPGIESTLDVEYIASTSAPIPLDFYIWPAMDFCSDMVGWTSNLLSQPQPGFVHSVSYGAQYFNPICDSSVRAQIDQDFMTLSVRGCSIIVASGDMGSGEYSRVGYNQGHLVPSWPSESIWCTAVGATYFYNQNLNIEMATDMFGSGGGFSWNEPQPNFQTAAIDEFFKNYDPKQLPPAKAYNIGGRATPDVSALGENYVVYYDGYVTSVSGTSCATPVFAGMVAKLNDIRLLKGQGTLGCINLLIYQNPEAFYDVTIGSDKIGPNTIGWDCTPGWDPVTGLGTPNYAVLEAIVNALP